jgi:hypothetical protein
MSCVAEDLVHVGLGMSTTEGNPADLLGGSFGFSLDLSPTPRVPPKSRRLARRIVRLFARPLAHAARPTRIPPDCSAFR